MSQDPANPSCLHTLQQTYWKKKRKKLQKLGERSEDLILELGADSVGRSSLVVSLEMNTKKEHVVIRELQTTNMMLYASLIASELNHGFVLHPKDQALQLLNLNKLTPRRPPDFMKIPFNYMFVSPL